MEKTNNTAIQVQVAFANDQVQVIIPLILSEPYYVERAIHQSGILLRFPTIDLTINKVGIFGEIVSLNTQLRSGDRIEIYRDLIIDPKRNRKQRAEKQKVISKSFQS